MRGLWGVGIHYAIVGVGLSLSLPGTAFAATAPILSKAMAQNTNDLQRAVWACEAGAPILAPAKPAAIKPRFFLGVVDSTANSRTGPPFTLGTGRLSGMGQISTDKGWSNIRFTCALSPSLDQARTFSFEILSPVATSSSPPSSSGAASGSDRRAWHVDGVDPLILTHGVPETDDRDFIARCAAKSGTISITLSRTVTGLKPGDYVIVGITSGSKSGLYVGRGVLDDELGIAMPVFTIGKDPLIAWIAAGTGLSINIGQETVYAVSLKSSAAAIQTFENGCRRAASSPVAS